MNSSTRISQYYVIGNPIQHSLSPDIHKQFATQTRQILSYERLLVPIEEFEETLNKLKNTTHGANITLPFKQRAYQYADKLTPRAQIAGAVNTLKWDENGECWGDNTDGIGLVADIQQNLNWPLTGKRILILGAGGATRGILKPLLDNHPNLIIIANRTLAKAELLAKEFQLFGPVIPHSGSFDNINHDQKFDLIINATSTGISDFSLPLNPLLIDPSTCCYDLYYQPKPTPFMRWALSHGSQHVSDGLGMLVSQAAESFYFWRGIRPDPIEVLQTLKGMNP